jgi:hypothetical protein
MIFQTPSEVQRLTGWRHGIWARRYQAVVISDEDFAQIERLRYVLAHGVKEFLVSRVTEWPGVHSAAVLLEGSPLEETWFNRTAEYSARQRGKSFHVRELAETETLCFDPLPCWAHLTPEQYRAKIADLVAEVEADAAAEREQTGCRPLSVKAILRQKPTNQPMKTKKSAAPSSTPSAAKCAKNSMKPTAGSWQRSGRRRKSSRAAIAPRGFQPGAFHRTCRSSVTWLSSALPRDRWPPPS